MRVLYATRPRIKLNRCLRHKNYASAIAKFHNRHRGYIASRQKLNDVLTSSVWMSERDAKQRVRPIYDTLLLTYHAAMAYATIAQHFDAFLGGAQLSNEHHQDPLLPCIDRWLDGHAPRPAS